jgi:hypothetical protein
MMELDFRAIQQPTLKLTFENGDIIHMLPPTHGMLARLQAMQAEADELRNLPDKQARHMSYDLFAELMSNNEENVTLTGKDLNLKYHLKWYQLTAFRDKFIQFVQSILSAKN